MLLTALLESEIHLTTTAVYMLLRVYEIHFTFRNNKQL